MSAKSPRIRTFPDLVRKEALAALVSLAAVALLSALADAPIDAAADLSGMPSEQVKAPAIFVGIQQMLRYLPSLAAGVILPLVGLLLLALVPFLPQKRTALGLLFFGTVLTALALTLWGYAA